jgi:hypothetical protein
MVSWLGLMKLIPKYTSGDCAANRFVMSNDFTDDKGQELFGKIGIEFADRSETPSTTDLLGFPAGIPRGQSVPGLQFADRVGTAEPLRQHADDRGIDIIDAIPQISKFGNGIGSIHHLARQTVRSIVVFRELSACRD